MTGTPTGYSLEGCNRDRERGLYILKDRARRLYRVIGDRERGFYRELGDRQRMLYREIGDRQRSLYREIDREGCIGK